MFCDYEMRVHCLRPLTKNYRVVRLDAMANATSLRAVWKRPESTDDDAVASQLNDWTSSNFTERNETLSLAPYEAAIVYGMTEIILTNLKHYQEYNIEVRVLCPAYF